MRRMAASSSRMELESAYSSQIGGSFVWGSAAKSKRENGAAGLRGSVIVGGTRPLESPPRSRQRPAQLQHPGRAHLGSVAEDPGPNLDRPRRACQGPQEPYGLLRAAPGDNSKLRLVHLFNRVKKD